MMDLESDVGRHIRGGLADRLERVLGPKSFDVDKVDSAVASKGVGNTIRRAFVRLLAR
jgi:hypothetical protein